jgi:CHAT domain-containing protein/tetratricopeptide (TPR) repeat protein
VKYLVVCIALCLVGTLHQGSSASYASVLLPKQSFSHRAQRPITLAGKPLSELTSPCIPLETDKPQKRTISSRGALCFAIEVREDEATQLQLDQPEDLEMRLIGGLEERLIDSFDLGIETLTISEPGSYWVEVREVKPLRDPLQISIVQWTLDLEKAAAWEEAETWATKSKKSREIADIDKSLALWVALGDTSSIARAYLKRGSVLSQNDWANARIAFEKGLELCRKVFDTRCFAEAENNSGTVSTRLGDFNDAQQSLGEAAKDWQKLEDKEHEGATLSNLGYMQYQVGNFGEAIANLDQAQAILRAKDSVGYAQAINNLGLCYQKLAEYERARSYFVRAIRGFIRGKSPRNVILARMNLGRNYMLEGRLQQAQKILETAVAEAEKLPARQPRADTLRNLAQTLYLAGKLDEAKSRLELALEVDRTTGNQRGQSSALHYLGLIAEKNKDIETARALLTQAVQIRREVGLRDDASDSLLALADLEYHDQHLEAARDFAEQALTLMESVRSQVQNSTLRAFYYSRKRQLFDLLVEIVMTESRQDAAANGLLAVEKGRGRALIDLLSSGSLPGQLPEGAAEQHANIQRQLDYLADVLAKTAPGKDSALRLRFQKLLDDDDALEDRIRQSLAGQKLAQPLKSIADLQSELRRTGSALLEYYLGDRQSYLWFVDADRIQVFPLPSAAKIESVVKPVVEEFGRILERRRSPAQQAAYKHALKKLSATLFSQLANVPLPERLILVPDGILHKVPFAALQIPDTAEPLGWAHDLLQVPSAAYLLAGARPRPIHKFPRTILAVADPVFSATDSRVLNPQVVATGHKSNADPNFGLSRLAFNGEIKIMEASIPRSRLQVLRGFAASRATLSHVQLEDFGVLHFSTHALINDSIPELSWIALSMVDRNGRAVDGLLHPYQLAQFHLAGSIVVLSACDTALGKQVWGEGLMGFSNSLLSAGASQLVLALTEIDAEASSSFLSNVYSEFLKGTNMEHSMTLARRKMAHSHRFSDPYYWASFVVIGRTTDAVNSGFAATYNRN